MVTLCPLEGGPSDWESVDALPDRLVYQSREWLDFLGVTQGARPVLAELLENDRLLGYFTGALVRKYGVPILGSPFRGWSSGPMGFTFVEEVDPADVLHALAEYAFGTLGCWHLELLDTDFGPMDPYGLGYQAKPHLTYQIDLERSEDEIFAGASSPCRRAIRKSERSGVRVEEAHDLGFADDYHAQLQEVFARQGAEPPYGPERVRQLIRALEPTGPRVLLLRALSGEGECIATGIFPGMNQLAFFWGGASRRAHSSVRPNEAVTWYAARWWKARGATRLDLGGGGENEGFRDYKLKFGPETVTVPALRRSRFGAVRHARDMAERVLTRRAA